MMKEKFLMIVLIMVELIVGVTSAFSEESKSSWPAIQSATKSFHFVDHRDTGIQMKINSTDGTPLYLLECYLNAYDHEDPNFDYSGDFECRLSSLYSKEKYSTLLTEEKHPTRDWQSRGRFLLEELQGKCSEYPEYGRLRHFKLRGMDLTLEIKNFTLGSATENEPWNRRRIKNLDLEVTVATDPTASSEIATPTKYVEPPRAHPQDTKDLSRKCDKVLTK